MSLMRTRLLKQTASLLKSTKASASLRNYGWTRTCERKRLIKVNQGGSLSVRCLSFECKNGKLVDVEVLEEGRIVLLSGEDGLRDRFHSIWLRHNCQSVKSKQQYSGQKIIDVSKVDPDIRIKEIINTDTDTIKIRWQTEQHITEIPVDLLVENSYSQSTLDQQSESAKGRLYSQEDVPRMAYWELLEGEMGFTRWLEMINEHGLCVLEGVPTEDGMVAEVGERIGPVPLTIYGKVFDVVSTVKPINVAYSDAELHLHQDLVYYESPPGLQLLHCVRFDDCVDGGNSTFLDVFHTAEEFRKKSPKHFEVLTQIPATFQKIHYERESAVHMVYQRPHIVLNHNHEIVGVNWAPAFEGPLKVKTELVEEYYKAYHLFAKAILESSNLKQTRLAAGDLVTFNNRRMLHGRKSFKLNGGVRHLQGCYINIDEYKSRVNYLYQRLKKPVRRVGNQDWQ
ncbi:hypothetical protein ScPMuIL_013740 [Solemya velum]